MNTEQLTTQDTDTTPAPSVQAMTLNDYQQAAITTAIYPHDYQLMYLALAMSGEVGEVADKVKKIVRDKESRVFQPDAKAIAAELGDVLWYAANLANVIGYKLSDIARLNIDKINSRIERGTLHGEGDER